MTAWLNLGLGIGAALLAMAMYLTDASALAMTGLLFLFGFLLFVRERTNWAIAYLGLMANLLFLFLALWLTNGNISYLSDEDFAPYYKKALLLETFFWASFGALLVLCMRARRQPAMGAEPICLGLPVKFQFLIAIAVLSLEIAISSGAYFKPYNDVSDTGTVAYELGCLLLALAITSRGAQTAGQRIYWLEALAIGLALFIVIGSGKRLPFAYVVIAYMLQSLRHYGKPVSALLFVVIAALSFGFGIVRDFMSVDGIDNAALLSGFYSTNQGGVLHASAVYLRIADEGLSSLPDRTISFLSNFGGALVLPMSLLPEQAQVNVHAMRHYDLQGNGGFIGSYAYFFLGWFGPVLLALLLAWLCSRRGRWFELLAMIVLLTSPRWTLYNLGPVMRLISMAMIILFAARLVYGFFLVGRQRRHALQSR